MLSMLGKMLADDISKYFSYLIPKIGFSISCKLSLVEIICMKCQMENNINLSFAE